MRSALCFAVVLAAFLGIASPFHAQNEKLRPYWVCVTNERSGDVTILDGATHKAVAFIPVGKRPRGIHPSPDGRFLYVAVSGTPISGPPKLDAKGNPIFEQKDDDEGDRTADGIAVVDLRQKKMIRKLPSGSDPEEFAVSKDGSRLYISNEDVGTVSVLNIGTQKVEQIIRVKKEPEGVSLTPDGKRIFVTCETGGEIIVIDAATYKQVAELTIGGRPRTVSFNTDGSRAFVCSESAGQLHFVDTANVKATKSIALPAGARPMASALSPDGRRLYVTTGRAGTVLVVDPFDGNVRTAIPVGKRPWGIAVAGDEKAFVANGPSNDVSVLDLRNDREIAKAAAGLSPWGVAIVPALE